MAMKRHVLNKNVNISGGVAYKKGDVIKKDMPGFEELHQAGHLDTEEFHAEKEDGAEGTNTPDGGPPIEGNDAAMIPGDAGNEKRGGKRR